MAQSRIIPLLDQDCAVDNESKNVIIPNFTIWLYPGEHYHISKASISGSFREGLFDATDSYPPPKYIN